MSENRNNECQLFETVWREVSQTIVEAKYTPAERQFLKSLVMGGTVTAEMAVHNCEGLAGCWNSGDEDKARGMARLFAWMMLSQCYRSLQTETAGPEDHLPPIGQYGKRLTGVFGQISEHDFNLLSGLDVQYNYDVEKKPHLIHLASLLLAAACEICGHPCLDWTNIRFPVKEMHQLAAKGAMVDTGPMRTQHDIEALKTALNTGTTAMIRYQEKKINMNKIQNNKFKINSKHQN